MAQIASLIIGKEKSVGLAGKNVRPMLGRPMCEYAFIAAKNLGYQNIFVSTDSSAIASVGLKYGAKHINRPPELATPESLTEDVLKHAFIEMEKAAGKIDIVCLFFANNPAIDLSLVKQGINILENNENFDSAFSVSKYNMFSPARARRVTDDKSIEPFVSLEHLANVSSIRDSQGDCYFCDLSVQVMKRQCFIEMDKGMQPFQWMGRKSYALLNNYGFDVDTEWQFTVLEQWLKEAGFNNEKTPYEQ